MDINLGNLMSNSNTLLKKVKGNNVNSVKNNFDEIKKKVNTAILEDFNKFDLKNSSAKTKFIKINNLLNEYEKQFSELQYIDQMLQKIDLLSGKNNKKKISDLIENSLFNDKTILKEYFNSANINTSELSRIKDTINEKFTSLDTELKKLDVTAQNLLSMYKMPINISSESIDKIDFEDLIKSSNLNKKRVLDLIS